MIARKSSPTYLEATNPVMTKQPVKTVAILEPHDILRHCLLTILSHLKYDVTIHTGDSLEFIENLAASEVPPDVIISEVQLHDLPDVSLFRHLRYHYPEVKLLAFSGDNSAWTTDAAIEEGANAFLLKGCSLYELQHTLLNL
jgi:DNA-binding NarL/FixJ family response regulator